MPSHISHACRTTATRLLLMNKLLAFLIIVLSVFAATAQRTTRRGLKPISPGRPHNTTQTLRLDTICNHNDCASIRLSGYDKPLRSRTASMHATNQSTDTIYGFVVDANYTDAHSNQLHAEILSIAAVIPPGQTRLVHMTAWDKQQSYYYHKSAKPKRTLYSPYHATMRIKAIIRRKK